MNFVSHALESPVAQMTTNTVAVGAVTSPLWLTQLSSAAVVVLPILGCTWLLLQIGHWGYKNWYGKK